MKNAAGAFTRRLELCRSVTKMIQDMGHKCISEVTASGSFKWKVKLAGIDRRILIRSNGTDWIAVDQYHYGWNERKVDMDIHEEVRIVIDVILLEHHL